MNPRRWIATLTVLLLALVLAACGSDSGAKSDSSGDKPAANTKVNLQTSFLFGGWDIPFFLALDKGYFADEGLDVTIRESSGSSTSIQSLLGGATDIAVSDGSSNVISAAEADGFISVATLADRFGSVLVSYKKDGIEEPADLVGKTVGIALGGRDAAMLESLLRLNDIDPSSVKIESLRPDQKAQYLKAGKVDVITFVDYSAVSIAPLDELNLMRMSDYGVNQVGLTLVVRTDWLEKNADTLRPFLRATAKAFAEAQADPTEAVDALMKRSPVMPAPVAKIQWELYQESFDLDEESRTKGFGWQSDALWNDMLDSLTEAGMIKEKKPLGDYFTNEYLPQ